MKVLALFVLFIQLSVVLAQWNNNFWWFNPQPQQQAAPAQNFNWFGSTGHQSDDKGNMWHGSDNAKLMLFAKSSWP